MRTIVYVDGYNLFYSALSKSSHKWLDLGLLFDKYLLRHNSPRAELIGIKYFTSPALSSMASDTRVSDRQAHYHRALKAQGRVETIKGYHQKAETTGIILTPIDEAPHITKIRVQVMEEKQTDVNIGLQMYRDAIRDHCDQIVLCSNDADLEPALKLIKEDCPNIQIGVVLPRKQINKSRLSRKLVQHAHWNRPYISDEELISSQLPNSLIDRRGRTITKPEEW